MRMILTGTAKDARAAERALEASPLQLQPVRDKAEIRVAAPK